MTDKETLSKAGSILGRHRFEKGGREGMAAAGRVGGRRTTERMTKEQLSARGKQGVAARMEKEAIRQEAYVAALRTLEQRQQLQKKNCAACLAAMEKALANPGRLIKQALASAKK